MLKIILYCFRYRENDYIQWAKQIKILFPFEEFGTWYIKYDKGPPPCSAKGILYTKLNKFRRKYNELHGKSLVSRIVIPYLFLIYLLYNMLSFFFLILRVFTNANISIIIYTYEWCIMFLNILVKLQSNICFKGCKKNDGPNTSTNASLVQEKVKISDDLAHKIEFLKSNYQPWSKILQYWKDTFEVRQNQQEEEKLSAGDLFIRDILVLNSRECLELVSQQHVFIFIYVQYYN